MTSTNVLRRLTLAVLCAAAVGLAGCGTEAPSGSPSPNSTSPSTVPPASSSGPTGTPASAANVYAQIRAQVEAIRGLAPSKPVEPVSLDEAALRANLTTDFDKQNTPAELRLAEDEFITLGLLPEGSDLRNVMLDFQTGQVAGYYSPDKDQLFVVSRGGDLGGPQMVTYAHEYTHQLDDQALDIGKLGLDVADQSDRQLARLALVEGDATSVQGSWMTTNLTPDQLGEVLRASLDPKALEALQKAPPFIRDQALFPYQAGLGFVTTLVADGGYAAVDAAFKSPPDSTEQIIHPEKYAAHEAPEQVEIPARVAGELGPGWSAAGQDTLGELILSLWLQQGGIPQAEARAAAAGWGGDRLVTLRGPDGAVGVGMVTTWDSPEDAAEFNATAGAAVQSLDPSGVVVSDGVRKVVVALGARAADVARALAASGT